MRFEDMNWMDVEEYLKTDDRLMLVLGSCEEHGYLSVCSDTRIPQAMADAASLKSGVIVAPALNFGVSPYFLTYPGTISLRMSTYMDVVEDMVRSVYGYGFRRILILNGHGGNNLVRGRLVELRNQLSDLQINWYAWWTEPTVVEVAKKYQLKPFHASWLEAFPYTRVCDLPQGEKEPVVSPVLANAEETRQMMGDGVFGGPYQVDDGIMSEIMAAAHQDIMKMLEFK